MKTLPELIDDFVSYYRDLAASQREDGADAPPPHEEWEFFRDHVAPDVGDAPLPAEVAAKLERYR